MRSIRGRVYRTELARMRAGFIGNWATDVRPYDRQLVKRLMDRVAYGGRKGHRAFVRLWQMRIRPRAMRVTIAIKGFELTPERAQKLVQMEQLLERT
jgi:hypothetical protein